MIEPTSLMKEEGLVASLLRVIGRVKIEGEEE